MEHASFMFEQQKQDCQTGLHFCMAQLVPGPMYRAYGVAATLGSYSRNNICWERFSCEQA